MGTISFAQTSCYTYFHLLSSYIMIILELLKFVLIQYFTLIRNILLLVITSFMIKSLKDFYMWLMFLWFYQRATRKCSNKTIKLSMPHFASIQDWCFFMEAPSCRGGFKKVHTFQTNDHTIVYDSLFLLKLPKFTSSINKGLRKCMPWGITNWWTWIFKRRD